MMTDSCTHPEVVPVELALTEEIVASLCVECGERLPVWYGCPNCEVEVMEIIALGGVVREHYDLIYACEEHR